MSAQGPTDSTKVTELFEKLEGSTVSLKKSIIEINTQISHIKDTLFDPLSNNNLAYKALEDERKKIHNIYPQIGDFFGVGAPSLERNPEGDCAVIGRAIIGKNIICG